MVSGSRTRKEEISTKHLFEEAETVGLLLEHSNTVQQNWKVQLLFKSTGILTQCVKTDFSKLTII